MGTDLVHVPREPESTFFLTDPRLHIHSEIEPYLIPLPHGRAVNHETSGIVLDVWYDLGFARGALTDLTWLYKQTARKLTDAMAGQRR